MRFEASLGKFKASLSYIVRPYQKKSVNRLELGVAHTYDSRAQETKPEGS